MANGKEKDVRVTLKANFTEAGTGVTLQAPTWDQELKYTPYTIEFAAAPRDHIVGYFPYSGKGDLFKLILMI